MQHEESKTEKILSLKESKGGLNKKIDLAKSSGTLQKDIFCSSVSMQKKYIELHQMLMGNDASISSKI